MLVILKIVFWVLGRLSLYKESTVDLVESSGLLSSLLAENPIWDIHIYILAPVESLVWKEGVRPDWPNGAGEINSTAKSLVPSTRVLLWRAHRVQLLWWFMGRASPSSPLLWKLSLSLWIGCRLGNDLHWFHLQSWTQLTAVFQSETTGKEEEERKALFSKHCTWCFWHHRSSWWTKKTSSHLLRFHTFWGVWR